MPRKQMPQILAELEGKIVVVNERVYNDGGYQMEPRHYKLILVNHSNWNWLTKQNERISEKSLRLVQVENPAVVFDAGIYSTSHVYDFAYHFGIIDDKHPMSDRPSDDYYYKPSTPKVNGDEIIQWGERRLR